MFYTTDLADPPTKPSGARNQASTGCKPMAASVGHSFQKLPEERESTSLLKEFLLGILMTQKHTKFGFPALTPS